MQTVDFKNSPFENVFMLVYGASGTGKTHLMGSLGELGYVAIIDSDRGWRTLQTAKDLTPFVDNIEVISFDKFKDLDTLYKLTAENDPTEWAKAAGLDKPFKKPFDWVVIDTWSEVQWYMLQELRKRSGLGGGDRERLDFRQNIQIQHWGAMTDLNKLAIEAFKSCKGVNIVFVMQEGSNKDELTGQIIKGPAIHGKLMQEVPAYFEVVVHTYSNVMGDWCATTLPKGGWPAKTRLGKGKDLKFPTAKELLL